MPDFKPTHPNMDSVMNIVDRLKEIISEDYDIDLTNDQINSAKSKTISFPFGMKGLNEPTYEISIYDFASSTYQELINNENILNRDLQDKINHAYHTLKEIIGIQLPENHFILFYEAFKYTTVCFRNFKNTDITINTRAYNSLVNSQLYYFDPDMSHLANLLDYHLFLKTPYHELLTIDGIGRTTANHIVNSLYDWSQKHNVHNFEDYPLFEYMD